MDERSDSGLWVDRKGGRLFPGRPALFLDRDGVVVEEVDYLGCAADVRMIPGLAPAIAVVNARDVPVVLVTNQSGIARGLFDWKDFEAVQHRIDAEMARENARLDLILACAHHEAGRLGFDIPNHPWRKPNPGMLLRAGDLLGVDLASSHIVGDKLSDLEAGAAAGLPGGTLVRTGHGASEVARSYTRRAALADLGFRSTVAADGAQAIETWLASL